METHSGEPMRVITGGVPHIPGNTVYEQMKWLEKNDDQIRMLMCREPRGYSPDVRQPSGAAQASGG